MQEQQVIAHIKSEHLLKPADEQLLLSGLEKALSWMDSGGDVDDMSQLEPYFSSFAAASCLLIETLGTNKVWMAYAKLDDNIHNFVDIFLKPFDKFVVKFRELDSSEYKRAISQMLTRALLTLVGISPPEEMLNKKSISDSHSYLGQISYTRYQKPKRLTKGAAGGSVSAMNLLKRNSGGPSTLVLSTQYSMWVFSDVLYFGESLDNTKRLRCEGARVVLNEQHLFLYAQDEVEAVESMSPVDSSANSVRLLEITLSHLFRNNTSASPRKAKKKKGSKLSKTLNRLRPGSVRQLPVVFDAAPAPEATRFPHKWVSCQLNKFTWCTYCKEFIWGLRLQSWSCECGHVIHRKCKFHVPPDCGDPSGSLSGKKTDAVRTTGIDHVFSMHNFSRLAYCGLCSEFIWGLARQGYKCDICGYPVHKECMMVALPDCTGKLIDHSDLASVISPRTRSMSRAALRQTLNINKAIDEEDDWNRLFVRLESNTHIPENDLKAMMALITRKEAESKKHPDAAEAGLLSAEVELAKTHLTAVWDRQEALKVSRSKGLVGIELELEEFLLCGNPAVFQFLNEICDEEEVATLLLEIFTHYDGERELVRHFVKQEVDDCVDSNTLFRGNGLGVRLTRKWLNASEGREYIRQTLTKPLADILNHDLKLSGPELEQRQQQLHTIVLGVLASIVSSLHAVPPVFYDVSHTIFTQVKQSYDEKAAITALGAFLFLRFLTPAILSPDEFGLMQDISLYQTQTLVTVAKVIQALVNNSSFPERDACSFFNPLLQQFGSKVDEFLRALVVARPSTTPIANKPKKEQLKRHKANLLALREFIQQKGNKVISEAAEVLAEDARLITLIQDILGELLK